MPYTDFGTIPVVAHHRGVGIENLQTDERIETIVKVEIDRVLDRLSTVTELYAFARSPLNCPEARQLAANKIIAQWEIATEDRRTRPQGITLDQVRTSICGLGRQNWRSTTEYCSALDTPAAPGAPRPAQRPRPLTEAERGR
jgi:hypothetical protein